MGAERVRRPLERAAQCMFSGSDSLNVTAMDARRGDRILRTVFESRRARQYVPHAWHPEILGKMQAEVEEEERLGHLRYVIKRMISPFGQLFQPRAAQFQPCRRSGRASLLSLASKWLSRAFMAF